MEVGGYPLCVELSKSPAWSQVPDLGLNGLKPELEHFPVRGAAGCRHLGLGLREGQFEAGPSSLARLIFGRKGGPQLFRALCLFLL